MKGAIIWLTGLPSSGKSTLAIALAAGLRRRKVACVLLDGDDVRAALRPVPGHSPRARGRFYATLGNLANLVARDSRVVIVAASSHLRRYREQARRPGVRFLEVFVDVPLAVCRLRDAKGLYAGAAAGNVQNLPGLAQGYEPPLAGFVRAKGGRDRAAVRAACDWLAS